MIYRIGIEIRIRDQDQRSGSEIWIRGDQNCKNGSKLAICLADNGEGNGPWNILKAVLCAGLTETVLRTLIRLVFHVFRAGGRHDGF